MLASSAQAQTGDWKTVESLPLGSRIAVRAEFRVICFLESVTPDQLVCELPDHDQTPFRRSELAFERRQIREVRLLHSEAADALVGAAIGASAGAAIGASADKNHRAGGALLLGIIGGIIGGYTTKDFVLVRSQLIYRR